jgi:hypothetical protein
MGRSIGTLATPCIGPVGIPCPMPSREAPLVVVGQPRSGSTITTRVLNECEGVFLLNDFYALQAIDAEGLWDRRDAAAASRVAEMVLDRLTIRSTQEAGKTLEQSIDLPAEALARVTDFARQDWPADSSWHEVLAGPMRGSCSSCANPRRSCGPTRTFPARGTTRGAIILRPSGSPGRLRPETSICGAGASPIR